MKPWLRRTLIALAYTIGLPIALALAASGIELWDASNSKYVGWQIDGATGAALVKVVP